MNKRHLLLSALALNALMAATTSSSIAAPTDAPIPSVSALAPGAEDRYNFAKKQVERFDSNKDGKVTREEYLAPADKTFSEADVNKDGVVTADELADSFLKRGIRVPSSSAPSPFK